MTDSTHSCSLALGSEPILVAATWPFLNRMSVGMPRTPYFIGVSGFSSSAGAIALQGLHHSAQKSTRTGPGARNTSASNELSVTFVGFIEFSHTGILQSSVAVVSGGPDRPRP